MLTGKKALLALAVSALVSTTAYAKDMGSGKLHFKGEVIEAPCEIDPNYVDQDIDLGQVTTSHINSTGYSENKQVEIKLINCTLNTTVKTGTESDLYSKVDVTFNSTAHVTEGSDLNLLDNTTAGAATGVGVRLLNSDGSKNITLGTPEEITLNQASAEQSLLFNARMELIDGTKATPATPGAVTAEATYVLEYK